MMFECLTYNSGGQTLDFEVLCGIAKHADGTVNRDKVKDLIRVFRPNRDGQLSKLEFVKSIDR